MGYDSFAPGNKVPDKLSPLQAALQGMPIDQAQEALDIIMKLTQNVVRNPTEEKFRRIKLTNPKIAASLTSVECAVAALKEMGWVEDGENLALPESVRLLHEKEVLALIDAKDWYKKQAENEKKRLMRANKTVDADKEALLQQLDGDRREKAAEGPVTKGSVAKQLGDGKKVTAGDIGIGKSSGG